MPPRWRVTSRVPTLSSRSWIASVIAEGEMPTADAAATIFPASAAATK